MMLIKFNIFYIIFFSLLFIFSKEWIVVNEEFIVAVSFIVLFFFIYKFSSSIIVDELDSRNVNLLNMYRSLFQLKLYNQKKLLNLYNKKIKLFRSLRRINGKVEDVIYYISLNRNLITAELCTRHAKNLIVSFLVKRNFKLRMIYENYLNNININLK